MPSQSAHAHHTLRNGTLDTRVLPHISTQRVWSPTGELDDVFTDWRNFNLSIDALAVVIAIITLLVIVLLTDIAFRIAVRHRADSRVSSHAICRDHLFSQTSNPLAWPAAAWAALPCGANGRGQRDNQRDQPAAFSLRTRIVVVLSALLVLASDLMFIFLATTRTKYKFVPRDRLPAFRVADPGTDFNYEAGVCAQSRCVPHPYTRRSGFVTIYPLNICSDCSFASRQEEPDGLPDRRDELLIQFDLFSGDLVYYISVYEMYISYHYYLFMAHPGGNRHLILPNVTRPAVKSALGRMLERRGVPFESEDFDNEETTFSTGLFANISNLRLSPQDVALGREFKLRHGLQWKNVSDTSVAWCLYMSAAVRSTLQFSGRSTAVENDLSDVSDDVRLAEDFAPVVLQRPRMSAFAALVLLSVMAVLWVAVAFGVKWQSRLDHRCAWLLVFEGFGSVEDLQVEPEQVVWLEAE